MIRINLLATTEQAKTRAAKVPKFEGVGTIGQNFLMAGVGSPGTELEFAL